MAVLRTLPHCALILTAILLALSTRRDVLLEILERPGIDFGKEIIPAALETHRVSPYIFRGYWADVGTIEAFYDANIQLTQRGAPFNFFHPRWPIYTHPRFLPPSRVYECRLESSIVAEGCHLDECEISDSVVGIRTQISPGARIMRSAFRGRLPGDAGYGNLGVRIVRVRVSTAI